MTRTPREAIVIVNAMSRKGEASFDDACAKLQAAGVTLLDRHPIADPADLEPTVKAAVASGAAMVIVGGGDGSLSTAVDHFVGTNTVFALLPLGTANSFARTLGIDLDLDGAIDVIANGQVRRVDLGMIDRDYYANNAAIGIAPLIAQTIPHWLKKYFGRVGYVAWVVVALSRFRPFKLTVEGTTIDATEVRIANGGFHGGTEVVESAEVDSGEIVVQAVIGRTRLGLAWSWLATALKLPQRHATLQEFRGRSLRVETRPSLPISIDGEILARTPVTAAVARGALLVAVPRPLVGSADQAIRVT